MSGPLLDRIDLRVVMARVPADVLIGGPPGETSRVVADRIARVRRVAIERSGLANARLTAGLLLDACRLEPAAGRLLTDLATTTGMTARGIHRSLRVARTIADLAGDERVGKESVAAAIALRQDGAAHMAAA